MANIDAASSTLETDVALPSKSSQWSLANRGPGSSGGSAGLATETTRMLEPSSSTDTPLDVGEEDEEAAGLTEHGPADEKQALKKADHGFLFPPPVIELRGREVILAIGLFLVFAVCIGLVVVMVTKNAKKRKLEESSGSSGQQVSHIGPADDGYDQDVCLTEACIRQSAYIIQSRDANIDPCEDFWKYTCGKWIETNPIPADRKFWSVNAAVEKQMTHRLKTLIEGLVTSQSPNSAQLKVKRFYQKCVDENVIDTDGLKEVSSYIDQLGGWAIHGKLCSQFYELSTTEIYLF